MTTATNTSIHPVTADTVIHGDWIDVMGRMETGSVDMILTAPPYITGYRSRDGQTVRNDDNARWLALAFAEAYRILKSGGFCVSFYGWNQADKFLVAWRAAGFRPVGHVVFRKRYPSAKRFLSYHHEQAYLLAKGQVQMPLLPIADVIDWRYERNTLHPTRKPVSVLTPLIKLFRIGSIGRIYTPRKAANSFPQKRLDPCVMARKVREQIPKPGHGSIGFRHVAPQRQDLATQLRCRLFLSR
ncbi:DNA methyltransferase [Mesorhizobium sp. KR1-2]|uniref:DNA methyltransferase n=1 Tax=Mesorhizobium sp. KR1-2 TaxID=3156609 RepID=UPI0032B466B7